jgi:hypothetical protein
VNRGIISKRIHDDDEYREEVCAWIRALGLNPNDIPMDAYPTVADGRLTIRQYVRSEKGAIQFDPNDVHAPLCRTVTVPITVEPSAAVAEWLNPRCPACGR